jgi:hypothetical protein
MDNVTLADGRTIEFDLGKLTIKEYRALFDPAQPEADEYATLAKVTGLSVEKVESLPLLEWKRVYRAFLTACAQPLADPN